MENSKASTGDHVIDLDADPHIPYEGWKVKEHRKGGQFTWDPVKLQLYLSEDQKDNKIVGSELCCFELADKPTLNANLLDYLLDHPDLIPEEWKGKAVFFWGTIYRDSKGYQMVRYLGFGVSRWERDYGWLDGYFGAGDPAVILAR